ncbi:MAG: class I SAM-dependent methyltransferase [Lachnospiraceae bacterium]|nr:class I SAM-dependent methyltransferase [Lachnospiraceae bacterium]
MAKNRFRFGSNWKQFIKSLDEERIMEAERSLIEWTGIDDFSGLSFLDIGSGSGLFSLAARRLGATVHSFDYDVDSVECTSYLKKRFFKGDPDWTVEQGDVLDEEYLSKYEEHDIVYSWGVLHHTGNMYKALENTGHKVKNGGRLFIAIYNDQGLQSEFWKKEKKLFNQLPYVLKLFVSIAYFIILWTVKIIVDFVRVKPFDHWKRYKKERGMSRWHDTVDWVGGYPFEVAKPEEIFSFYKNRGFVLEKMSTLGVGHGCNQYVFRKCNIPDNTEGQ